MYVQYKNSAKYMFLPPFFCTSHYYLNKYLAIKNVYSCFLCCTFIVINNNKH